MTSYPLLAAAAAIAVLCGLFTIVAGVRRTVPTAGAPDSSMTLRITRVGDWYAELQPMTKRTLVGGVVAGVVIWFLSGWVIAVVLVPLALIGIPWLLYDNSGTREIDRLEAMEEWTRGLASVLERGTGLEQALERSLRSTPEAIRPEVGALVRSLKARKPTPAALRAFADDLDDTTGDTISSNLLRAASSSRGSGLAGTLDALAKSVTDDVIARRKIEAERSKPRTNARLITLITLAVLGLLLLRGDWIAPYGTPLGQGILIVLLSGYIGCLVWMRRMAKPERLPRFVGAKLARQNAEQTAQKEPTS